MAQNESDWRPRAIVFDLLTALLDSWSLWDASTPSRTPGEGRRWRKQHLELTLGAGAYGPSTAYESPVEQAARDVGPPGIGARRAPAGLAAPAGVARGRAGPGSAERGGVQVGHGDELPGGAGGRRCAERVEEHVGARFRFDAAITAEESGFYKPVKAAYEAVFPKLGVGADEVLFIAGSAGDVHGAVDAGMMRVIWHNKVGLAKKGDAIAMKESKTLGDALQGSL